MLKTSYNNPAIDALVNVKYLFSIATGYKHGAMVAIEDTKAGPTFETLASLSIELFIKVLKGCKISLKQKGNNKSSEEIFSEINTEIFNFKHDLKKLFCSESDLCKNLGIKKVVTIKNEHYFIYELTLEDSTVIYLKDFASVKYGTFSSKPNLSWGEPGNRHNIKLFLNKIEEYTKNQQTLAFRHIQDMFRTVVIRGPLGVGKTTVSKILAQKINAKYISLDQVLDDNHLIAPDADGIPVEAYLKANEIIMQMVAGTNTTCIVDGCFYYQEQIDDLTKKCAGNIEFFSLVSDVEKCIERDSKRPKVFGEDSARYVHMITTKIKAGHEIDTNNLTADETVEKIMKNLNPEK